MAAVKALGRRYSSSFFLGTSKAMRSPERRRRETSLERRYLTFLAEVGVILGEPLPYEATLQSVCDAAVRTVADIATMYLYDEESRLQPVAAAHVSSDRSSQLLKRAAAMLRDPAGPRAWLESIVRRGNGVLIPNADEDSLRRVSLAPEHAHFLLDLGVRSFVVVPLIAPQGEKLGALGLVYTHESGLFYDEESMVIAEDLARRCAAAIAKAKLHQTAIDVSTRFQLAALPKSLPTIPGIELDSFYEPASSALLVGGDWFDAFELSDGKVGLTIGDVSGHGVEAAVIMGNLRSALRTAMTIEPDLVKVLAFVDSLVQKDVVSGTFATANIGVLDPKNGKLSCVAAGHPGPLCWHENGQIVTDPFRERGLPLGFRDMGISQDRAETIDLEDCSFAVFFTDGLVEFERDYVGGEARLTQAIAQRSVRTAKHPARAIRNAVSPARHPDDLAVLTLRVIS